MAVAIKALLLALLLTPILLFVASAVYADLNRQAGGKLEPYKYRIIAVTVGAQVLVATLIRLYGATLIEIWGQP